MVLDAMLLKARKTGLHPSAAPRSKSACAVNFDELVQQLADRFAPGSVHQAPWRSALIVSIRIAVLVVHGPHAHAAGMVPGKKCHMSLHK